MFPAPAMSFFELMSKGGDVMWPLLLLSVVALGLILERAWFFARTNNGHTLRSVAKLTTLLRQGRRGEALHLADTDSTVYGQVARSLLIGDKPATEALAVDAIEAQRRRLERFMPTLSTIITAAPMLGILGTVLGIIVSFEAISTQTGLPEAASGATSGGGVADPRAVGSGIAEALITTAAGLIVAVVTLFPYNALRSQVDRTLSRLESLAAAAVEGGQHREPAADKT
jgi:biopolymer transport protein ExbB